MRYGIIPAYAGSTARGTRCTGSRGDHPRIRGEHVCWIDERNPGQGSSPHTRGARDRLPAAARLRGIIPAYAGSTGIWSEWTARLRDHPRIRGEHRPGESYRLLVTGSSPHTRGALPAGPQTRLPRGIIPAYAGSTLIKSIWVKNGGDHPRIRGEHPVELIENAHSPGSSPHTRGAPDLRAFHALERGIIPAYAGSTGSSIRRRANSGDHPRIRGEHIQSRSSFRRRVGSSPHTRGALNQLVHPGVLFGIIPAYAGSTGPGFGRAPRTGDHPRIRGEH